MHWFHISYIKGRHCKMYTKMKYNIYDKLQFHTKNTRLNKFICPNFSWEYPSCGKGHNCGYFGPIILFCDGDDEHPKYWYYPLNKRFPQNTKNDKILDGNNECICSTSTTTNDNISGIYATSQKVQEYHLNLTLQIILVVHNIFPMTKVSFS